MSHRRALTAALLALLAPAPAAGAFEVLNLAHAGGEKDFPANTLYAFKQSVRAGADMLELDVGVTKDSKVVVLHDTTLEGRTNGRGTVVSRTLRQLRRLDGAHWFSDDAKDRYRRDLPSRRYPFRGIATGRKKPPKGFARADFRIPTLAEVLAAFPRTPMTIEIKGRTPDEADAEYVANAEVLAGLLEAHERDDLIVSSFKQAAVDRFHELLPRVGVAPGIEGSAAYLLQGGSPGDGVVAFALPMTYVFGGTKFQIASEENIGRAHRDGYLWHSWFSGDDVDGPAGWKQLVAWCADGIITSRVKRLERFLAANPPPASCG